jgi:hypothetical protein
MSRFRCEHCGHWAQLRSPRQRYCSDACRAEAWRERRAEELLRREPQPPHLTPLSRSSWFLSLGEELGFGTCAIREEDDGSLACSIASCWTRADCEHRRLFRRLRAEGDK